MSGPLGTSPKDYLPLISISTGPDLPHSPTSSHPPRPTKRHRLILWGAALITTISLATNVYLACSHYDSAQKVDLDATTEVQETSLTPLTRLGFDQVFVINLERRPDHLARMRGIADFMHLNMTVFSATDKLTLDRSKFPPGSEGMGDSYLACWDSHMRVYQEVVDNPAIETALILEDDVDFDFDIVAKVARARAAIGDRPWDIFYLGHCESGWGNPRNALDSFPGVFHSSSPACTHGYAVSKRGARKLVQELTPPNAPVDIMLDNLITRKVLESLAMHPPLITQVHLKGDQSDINPDGKFGYVGDNVDTSAEGRLKLLRQLH